MKLIKSSFEILEQGPGLEGIYEVIERAGRTCYKSTRPEGQTAKDFVDRMIASKHYAMLEHGTVYLSISTPCDLCGGVMIERYRNNPYSKVNFSSYCMDTNVYITTNYRVLVENGWLDDLKYLCEPTEFHEKRVTVRFTTDRGISHEFVRHRVFSFAQESTRYCNYSKDKFGNELTFIIPSWCGNRDGIQAPADYLFDYEMPDMFLEDFGEEQGWLYYSLLLSERNYFKLLEKGWTPQQARQVLPNALKTELVMTGFTSDWEHLFRLRTSFIAETGKPHPNMAALCDPLYNKFKELNLI